MAILVFQITKDGSSFDTVSYASNIQSYKLMLHFGVTIIV